MISEDILKKIKAGAKVRVFLTIGTSVQTKKKGAAPAAEATSVFEGLVLARKHGSETGATFTVRTTLAGVGVEKIFPINLPSIIKVEIISSPNKIHRSKLYFVRKFSGRKTRQRLGVSI